jgi:hypothetical protein
MIDKLDRYAVGMKLQSPAVALLFFFFFFFLYKHRI